MDENMDQKRLIIKEIIQARELVKELQAQLNPSSVSGQDLITRILCSVENFLSMLERVNMENESGLESPLGYVSGSPNSDIFHGGSRKRKGIVRWTEQIRASAQTGLEGPLDDGYDWRKYGQKDILGAKHPRGYYKCSHRNGQGCLAMKQVQRSELESSIFNVTYIGKHSCIETSELLSEQYSPIKQDHDQRHRPNYHQEQREDISFEETYINFQTSSVQVGKDKDKFFESFPSFSIYSTTSIQPNVGNCSETKDNHFFPPSVKPEIHSPSLSPSPTFISTPTASESNYKMNSIEGYNIGEDLLQTTADSHDVKDHMIISPIVSATSCANNSCTNLMDSSWDWDFPIDYSPPQF
ncbi:hypothetical protein C5167_027395 [Papaver somniferum]|uniref:probable WRKY transcription factor 53 n=1 Tax=Papaver somniferum TaxID=3469 RepID=UPI000E6F9042|nr:probable WRKY transcription factor 53 [Papaver somniferum]RZC91336.1 hypothetical protein C5167_027395 [Papaver somniferum]